LRAQIKSTLPGAITEGTLADRGVATGMLLAVNDSFAAIATSRRTFVVIERAAVPPDIAIGDRVQAKQDQGRIRVTPAQAQIDRTPDHAPRSR